MSAPPGSLGAGPYARPRPCLVSARATMAAAVTALLRPQVAEAAAAGSHRLQFLLALAWLPCRWCQRLNDAQIAMIEEMMERPNAHPNLQNARVSWPVDADGRVSFLSSWAEWKQWYLWTDSKYRGCIAAGMAFYRLTAKEEGPAWITGACLSRVRSRAKLQAPWYLGDRIMKFLNVSVRKLMHWRDFKLDWAIFGFRKCGTTSFVYNMGLHPELQVEAEYPVVLESMLHSNSRGFLPHADTVRLIRFRAGARDRRKAVLGHPDLDKPLVAPRRLLGLKPMTLDDGNLHGAPYDPHLLGVQAIQWFMLGVLRRSLPKMRLFFVLRDPAARVESQYRWMFHSEADASVSAALKRCVLQDMSEREGVCLRTVGDASYSRILGTFCELESCTPESVAMLLMSQTADRAALSAAFSWLGVDATFAHNEQAGFRVGNANPRQLSLDIETVDALYGLFSSEVDGTAELLDNFSLVPGTAQLFRQEVSRNWQRFRSSAAAPR